MPAHSAGEIARAGHPGTAQLVADLSETMDAAPPGYKGNESCSATGPADYVAPGRQCRRPAETGSTLWNGRSRRREMVRRRTSSTNTRIGPRMRSAHRETRLPRHSKDARNSSKSSLYPRIVWSHRSTTAGWAAPQPAAASLGERNAMDFT